MFIAVDFDSTCVTDAYPGVGEDIGAAPVLRELVEKGHELILWTMRSGKTLALAQQWFEKNGIALYAVNENSAQRGWTTSPKAYAHILIDDVALGCPLIRSDRAEPYVDWKRIREELIARKVL